MKTESNVKPSARFEIEAFPAKEGAACTVILYDNISGPFERPAMTEGEAPDTYYEYDRYEINTSYRENLEASVEASFDTWLQAAKEAEAAPEPETELEILKKQVSDLQDENASLAAAVDDLTIAILMGGDSLV